MTTSARIDWVDYAKGISIILVVMMHSTLSSEEALGAAGWLHGVVEFARPFRIPAFFLIAGLFVEALQNFTQMGFSIAVDDIGAGYSGLEKIAHLNPRYLKFDMQLVRDIDQSNVKREMARALKTFAGKMDSKIIAEGIERDGERQACVDLGIDFGQGYLLARPGPLETFNLGAAVPSPALG